MYCRDIKLIGFKEFSNKIMKEFSETHPKEYYNSNQRSLFFTILMQDWLNGKFDNFKKDYMT